PAQQLAFVHGWLAQLDEPPAPAPPSVAPAVPPDPFAPASAAPLPPLPALEPSRPAWPPVPELPPDPDAPPVALPSPLPVEQSHSPYAEPPSRQICRPLHRPGPSQLTTDPGTQPAGPRVFVLA